MIYSPKISLINLTISKLFLKMMALVVIVTIFLPINILSTTDYLPYGTERIHTGIQSIRKYIGEELDQTTGLNYLNARYYNSGTGQFTSQDPVFWEVGSSENGKKALLNPQSQNSYSYSLNNPLTYKDPDGEFPALAIPLAIAVQAAKGAIIGTVTNIAIQGAYDAYNGDLSSRQTYTQTAIEGAAVGATTFGAASFIGVGKVAPVVSEKSGVVLKDLKVVKTAGPKLEKLSKEFNTSIDDIISHVQENGKSYLDTKSGNINFFSNNIDKTIGYTRVTVEPTLNRIISAGRNEVRNVVNGIKSGRFTDFKK